ncbi:MAG: hypothetical protein JSV96_16165 [Candidatus Aminicenantes bacterium]|nr:MAG: hypothetical protein JSV96_16165 [Candidatus Aminicenantes bacterium]
MALGSKNKNEKQGSVGRKLKILLDKLHGEKHWMYPELIRILSERCEVSMLQKKPLDIKQMSQSDVFMLISPKKSWEDSEINAVHEYVESYGGILAIITTQGRKPKNINKLLETYGLEVGGEVAGEKILSREHLDDSPLLENVDTIALGSITIGCTKIMASSEATILCKYKGDVLGAKRDYGKGAVYLFSCLGAFDDKQLERLDNKVFLNNMLKSFITPEMKSTLEVIESDEALVKPDSVESIKKQRETSLKGEIKVCWTKDFKEMGFKNPAAVHTAIALDAKRIIFEYQGKLQIYGFLGEQKQITTIKPYGICDLAVSSNCSKILLSGKNKLITYNRYGSEAFKVDSYAEHMSVKMALDGRISAAVGKEYIQLIDMKGNFLGALHSAWGSKFLGGRAEFLNVLISPNGSYIVHTSQGGMALNYVAVNALPERDVLLQIPERERSKICFGDEISVDKDIALSWYPASASNKRLTLVLNNKICILDINGKEIQTFLGPYPLEEKSLSIQDIQATSDGKYLLYLTYDKHENKTSFNVFDVEKSSKMKGLLEFPTSNVKFIPSHDGSNVVFIIDKQIKMIALS